MKLVERYAGAWPRGVRGVRRGLPVGVVHHRLEDVRPSGRAETAASRSESSA